MTKNYCENKSTKSTPETVVYRYSERQFFKKCRKIMMKFCGISVNDPVASAHSNK